MTPLFIILFVLAVSLTIPMIIKPILADQKARNGVDNCDLYSGNYHFLLKNDRFAALKELSARNVFDALEYTFHADTSTITFSHLSAKIDYRLTFIEHNGCTYLKVSRIPRLHDQSNIPYMINTFFIQKLNATPVDSTFFASLNSESI